MEPAGIVACFKDLQQRSSEISEIILDNDGNTIDAINSAGFYPKITRDRNHIVKNLTGKIMKIFPTKSNARDYFLKRLKDPLTYGRDSQWLSKYYSAVVDHSSGDHSNCTDTCSKGAAKPFFGKLAAAKVNMLRHLFDECSVMADAFVRMKSTSQVESVHRSVIAYTGYKVTRYPKSIKRRVALAIASRNDGLSKTVTAMHRTLKLPSLSQKVIKRLGSFAKRKKKDRKRLINQSKLIREQQEKKKR